MLNSTLIKLLRSFTKTEIKDFGNMINSPYFNKKSAVVKFWEAVSIYAPDFKSKELERENIYNRIFPGKKYNYGTLKNLIYDVNQLAENFIMLKTYNAKTGLQHIHLLEGFLEKGLNDFFNKNIRAFENTVEENKNEEDYYKNKYTLEILKQSFLIQRDRFYNNSESIKKANEILTRSYFENIFNNNYSMMIWHYEHGGDYKNDFIKKIISYYKSSPVEMDYKVKIYYNAFMLFYDGSPVHFHELKKLLEENLDKLNSEQKYNFFLAVGNFCIKKYNEGSMEFAKHEYETYRFMIDNNIYNSNNSMTMGGTFYKNVAIAALKYNKISWAHSFIEKYKNMLEPEIRENYYFHALIEYNIKLKKFREAVKYISRIKYTDSVAKLNIKKWEIITGYELGHFEELRYMIDSAKHFLRNEKKISPINKNIYLNFISFINRTMVLKEKQKWKAVSSHEINILRRELMSAHTSHKGWLLEKVNELTT
jgi:hypothetical protein